MMKLKSHIPALALKPPDKEGMMKIRMAQWVSKLALVAAITASGASGAVAQSTADSEPEPGKSQAEAEPGNQIVVTGVILQNQEAIEAKREDDSISEFIFADEIGQYPDYNISDAIRRVSGVNTIFDEDEGRYIAMRGMDADFTYVSLDGTPIAALDLGGDLGGGRRVLLEAVPSFAVDSVQIYKTASADRDGQGIGGQVDLRTRSALDRPGLHVRAFGAVGYYFSDDYPTSDNGPSFRFDGSLTNTFGPDDQFGIVLSGSYMLKDRDQERFSPGSYTYRDANGDPVADPESDPYVLATPGFIVQRAYKHEIERYGGLVKLEHAEGSDFRQSLLFQYYAQADDEERADTFPNAGTVTSWDGEFYTVDNADATSRIQFWDIEKTVASAVYNMDYDLDAQSHIDLRASFSRSTWNEYVPRTAFFTARNIDYRATPGDRDTGAQFVIDDPASSYFDPAQYNRFDARLRIDDEVEEVWFVAADYGNNVGPTASGLGFRAGASWRQVERDFDRDSFRYRQGTGFNLNLSQFLIDDTFSPVFASYPLLIHDAPALFDLILAEDDGNAGQFRFDEAFALTNSRVSDYLVRENVFAGYGQIVHEGPRHRLEAGLRVEYTDVFAVANQDVTTTSLVNGRPVTTTVLGTIERTSNYTNVLPSINFIYDLDDGLRLRAAYSETIGRPSWRSISGTVDIREDEITGITRITSGNPDLRPRVSRNYDIELAYYTPDDNTLISIGAFYKDIRDDIFVRTETSDDGLLIVTQPLNVESSYVLGMEFSLVQNKLDFLPGFLSDFGVALNLTLIKAEINVDDETSFDYRLEQPELLMNASLFYQSGPFEARLIYNHSGEQPTSIDVGSPILTQWEQTFEQLDLNVNYALSDEVRLVLQGRNLTNEDRVINEGPDQSQIWDFSRFGPQVWLGANVKF
jgi:TonB-dependent receptor